MRHSAPSYAVRQTLICLVALLFAPLAAYSQTAESDSLYSKGMTLLEEGRYKEAIEKFRNVWELDSVNVPIYMPIHESGKDWMAYAYLKSGNKAMAKHLNPSGYDMKPDDRRKMGRINELCTQFHDDYQNQMWTLAELHLSSAVDEARRIYGEQSVIYLQSLVGLAGFYYEMVYYDRQNLKKLAETIDKLDRLIETLPTETTYLSASTHLYKGYLNLSKGKYAEALADVRKCREELKGLEHVAMYGYGRMVNLYGLITYSGDPEIFGSAEKALEDLKEIIDDNIKIYFSLPSYKQIDGADIISSSLDMLLKYPNVKSDEYDGKMDRYIEILRAADREKYPYIDAALSYALFCRAMINNISANFTGKGYEKVWQYADEAIKLADESPRIDKKDCLELMLVGANALISMQRFEEAERIIDEVLELAVDISNNRQYYLIDALKGKSLIQQRNGRIDLAIETMRKHLPAVRSMKKQYPIEVADLLRNYTEWLSGDRRNLKEYTSVLKEVIACLEKLEYPELQPNYTYALLSLASIGTSEAEQEEAFSKAEALIEKLKANPLAGPENIAFQQINFLYKRAEAAKAHEDYKKALEYITEALSIEEKSGMGRLAFLHNAEIEIYMAMNNIASAAGAGEEWLANCIETYGPDDLNTIRAMSQMISIYGANLNYDKAQEMVTGIEKALDNSWKSLSPESQLQILILIGNYYNDVRKHDKAIEVFESAKALMANKDVDPIWEMYLMPGYLSAKIKTEKSEEAFEECKRLASGLDKKGYTPAQNFMMLISLATVAKDYGEIGQASEWMSKAYEIYELHDGDKEMGIIYLSSLVPYNDLLTQMGFHDKALEVSRKFLETAGRINIGDGFIGDVLQGVRNIFDWDGIGDTNIAFEQMEGLYAEVVKHSGETSETAQNFKKSLIEMYPNMGHSMQETFEYGLDVIHRLREQNKTPLPALVLAMLTCAQYVDEPDETELLMTDMAKIPESQMTALERIRLLGIKANLALKKNETATAMALYREAFEKSRAFVLDNFLTMSAEERENFWNNSHQFFRTQIPQAAVVGINGGGEGEGFETLVYDCALFTNSLLLSSDITIAEAATSSKDKKVKKAYKEYETLRYQLAEAEKIYAGRARVDPEFDRRIEDLRTSVTKSERSLLGMLATKLGRYNSHLAIDSEDVRNALRPTDAAIEFLEFPHMDSPEVNCYMAAVIKGNDEVKLVPLFAITPDSEQWLECYDNNDLFNVLWKPLEEHLQGVTDIWFAPQGKLAVTAVESLPGLETLELGNPFELHRLTSTRQLAINKMNEEKRNSKNAEYVAYGGINYESADNEVAEKVKERRKMQGRTIRSATDVAEVLRSQNRDKMHKIEELPGTEIEARYLSDLVTEEKRGISTLFSGSKATEGSFKDYSGCKPVVIHIGTHGFYFDRPQRNAGISPEQQAMHLSGLLFAGAEKGLYDPESIPFDSEDGILTASEISHLDLSGPELIVLSACETGLGKVSADGVFGLQRGFKKAGANALMMSLWKVDDEATTKLMEMFYDGWLRKGMTKSRAFQYAKETLRSNPKWDSPEYWAPFILLDALER